MQKINLMDRCFEHDVGMVNKKKSKFIEWDRDRKNIDGLTFYTHRFVYPVAPNSILMLWESEGMYGPAFSNHVRQLAHHYKYIFTSWASLLDLPNARFIPSGGVWLSDDEMKVYPKSKLCSLVSSNKKQLPLHQFRFQLAQEGLADVYGLSRYAEPLDYLKDYMFSIIIENNIDDYYFTEKILNCFATGTIPIYIGARHIADFFNPEGIIQANVNNIREITSNIKEEEYIKRLQAINDNFERVKDFDCIEDYIWRHYSNLL